MIVGGAMAVAQVSAAVGEVIIGIKRINNEGGG